jgi:glucose/arabinose dehydrogenase
VSEYAVGLIHPRWLYVLPNGDVLVAETNAPPARGSGLRAWVMAWAKKRAGGAVPSPDRISLLRDADGDGKAEIRTIFIDGLHSPFGMALVGDDLYVANTDALVRLPYAEDATRLSGPRVPVTDLPAGEINRHWTRNVIASADGSKLYVSVGSDSNIAENGLEKEARRAAILEVDTATGRTRTFATGLRNPVGMAWHPETGVLWTAVNERDEIGHDLVPDYLTSVVEDGFYGWPFSYFGRHVDERVKPQRPDLVERAIVPDYALGAHTASLGLAFVQGPPLAPRFAQGAFVGQHGSWNRKPLAGYRVIFVPFANGRPAGLPEEVLTDFVDESGDARGRPVGVAIDRSGALLVADDVGNVVWRVTPATVPDSISDTTAALPPASP